MINANLAVDGQPVPADIDLDSNLSDHGVSSLDVVAFAHMVGREFEVTFTTEDCASLANLRSLVDFLDS